MAGLSERRESIAGCLSEFYVGGDRMAKALAELDAYTNVAVTAALTEAADDLHEAAQAITNTDASSRARKAALTQAVRTLRSRIQPP